MGLFSDILNDNTNSSCILLHGNVTDCVISKDLCFREFFVALADILRENGFDNIVFYDSSNALGKYVLDDQSAYYSIQEAKEAYIKKYGQPPKSGNPNVSTKQQTNASVSGNIITFGKPRKKVSGSSDSSQIVKQSNCSSDTIVYQQKNLLESVFYGECQAFMNNDEYRSAVIFTDINNFLQTEESRTRYAQVIHDHWRKNNLLIFIHPDLTAENDQNFFMLLKQSGIIEYFYTPGASSNDYIPKEGRVFRIGNYGRDEIFYLLQFHQIYNGLSFPEGIEVAAEKISYIVSSINGKQSYDKNLTLRSLNSKMERIIRNSFETELNDSFIEKLLDCNISDYDFNPWETLKSRHGWETVVAELEELFGSNMPDKSSLFTNPYFNQKTLLVERINGNANKSYPTSNKLPHLMLEGSPGTGKSTIITQIGRLMRDYGLLSIGHIVKAYRSDLIADVIGGTAIKVHNMLDKAENGILFIDEAYDLCKDYNDGSNAGTFAQEAINTLVNAMTDDTRHVVVIFAGYRCSTVDSVDGVRGLFKMNQGLADRIKRIITIPDYTPDVLTKIFFDVLSEHGYSLSDELDEGSIRTFMDNVYQARNRRDFSNGRFVKDNLIEKKLIINAQSRGDAHTIIKADFTDDAYKLEKVTRESVNKELLTYPGLGEIGVKIIDDYIDYRQMQQEDGIQIDDIDNLEHLIFKGNPGTGKTTIVKLLCKALGVANVMSGAPPIMISNPENTTLQQITEKIKDAVNYNTMLCIDEAHNCPSEIIHSLLNPMSENKKLTCVFCVYPDRYDEFLRKDKGLGRRTRTYTIEDYTPDQLLDIFKSIASKNNRNYSDDCINQLALLFDNWYQTRSTKQDYGNAGDVERLLRLMKENCYKRTKRSDSIEDKHTLLPSDIPKEHQEIIESQSGERSISEILDSIDSYIGWKELKDWLRKSYNQIKYKQIRPTHVVNKSHMRFVGSPGTGKTTAGKLFAEAAYAMGLVASKRFKYCTAKDLIAGFMGQSQEKAAKAFEEGKNGVIFIDEAYSLAYNDSFGNGSDYKKEVIEYLLAFSEENRDSTIIILAGYERLIEKLVDSNEGLRSRFPVTIRFPNYGADDCTLILKSMLEKEDYTLCSNFADISEQYFTLFCKLENFANARDVRNICDFIKDAHINRIISSGDTDVNDIITDEDLRQGFEMWNSSINL